MRSFCALLLIATLSLACQSTPSDAPGPDKPGPADKVLGAETERTPSRQFSVRYVAYVKGAATDKPLRVWIPLPSDDPAQTIRNLKVSGVDAGLTQQVTREATHGNKLLVLEGTPRQADFTIEVRYDVARYEYKIDQTAFGTDDGAVDAALATYQRPGALTVVNARIQALSDRLAAGKPGTLEKARAFYEHIIGEMTYGKPKDKPWGRGDTIYACDAKVGNCTDFHSYFISLCRAQKIPARFQIGLFGPYDRTDGEVKTGGYHCWAEFHVPGKGWVPVDISEADKRVDKGTAASQVFFGYHTDNRVTLSVGRDLVLTPRQAGAPLNYLIHPYAEVDGKPFRIAKQGFWTDVR